MGDRASVSFAKDGFESVVLCSHWGGKEFHKQAREYAKALKKERNRNDGKPLDRLEPDTVMVDFIREVTKDLIRVESNYYLGKTEDDVDNSDAGHVTIKL